jgi:hypothetical protein
MVLDGVWQYASDVERRVGCLEERLERSLVRGDFAPLPIKDDDEPAPALASGS